MLFPDYRPRRLRQNETFRRMIRETALAVDDLILPLFAIGGKGVKKPIPSMPGNFQLSVELVAKAAKEAKALGIPAVLLFGIPDRKDPIGTAAYAGDGIVQRAIQAIKEDAPDLLVITDVCLCEYTDHGHCGCIEDGCIDNDTTLELLARTALSHAKAGADMVAPSAMMDGQIGGDPRGARRGRFQPHPDHGLLGEVRLLLLRPLPGGGRERAHVRRPAGLPDGPGQRARGDPGDHPRRGGGGGHHHGQARPRLSRRHPPGARRSSTCRSPPTT